MSSQNKLKFTTALGPNNRDCGLPNTIGCPSNVARCIKMRASHVRDAGMPERNPPTPISDPDFKGQVTDCNGLYTLYSDLNTSYEQLYAQFQSDITDITTNGTHIDVDQDFFDDMYNKSSGHPQLVNSNGTLIIANHSQTYIRLIDNITFNPEPLNGQTFYDKEIITKSSQSSLMFGTPPRLGYTLGWFATIAIENQKGTVIDLNGKTLKQSALHNLQQRFFANIELASSPFDAQGPATFGGSVPAQNVYIKGPGTIGLSSHHGVHGNGHKESNGSLTPIQNILFENVTFENYEIAGFHLNGFKNVIIKDCTFKHHNQSLSVRATLSAVNFLKPYINAVASSDVSQNALYQYGELGEQKYEWYKNKLEESVNAMYDGILGGQSSTWNENNETNGFWYKLFANTPVGEITQGSGNVSVTDGVAYGIVGNARGVAVNGFPTAIPDLSSQYLYIKDTTVNKVLSNAHEIPGVAPPKSDSSANYPLYNGDSIVITHDPAGAVMSPFLSFTKYDSQGNFHEEFLNVSDTTVNSTDHTLANIQNSIPFIKPRIENADKIISDPTKVHFNTLLACQLIVTKNKDQLQAYYNKDTTNNYQVFDITKAAHNPAYDTWTKGETKNHPSGNWTTPYSTQSTASLRTYENSFRSSFHYLTGISDITQSYGTLTSNPFTASEIRDLGITETWDVQRDASTKVNSKITTGHDFMAHVTKPALGLKLDGIENVYVSGVKLHDICQFGRPGSDWNGKYEFGQPKAVYGAADAARLKGYTGATVEGIVLSSSYNVALHDIELKNLHSSFSSVVGINSLWEASNNRIDYITPNNLVSGIHYYGSTIKYATPSLYKYNPTSQPRMVIYKYSNTVKNKEFCEIKKPTSFGIAPTWFNPQSLLLTKEVYPPNTW